MNDTSNNISFAFDNPDGSKSTYEVKVHHAEALAVGLLDEASKRHPDRQKPLVERIPLLSIPHPSFVLNTTLMHEVVLALAPKEWRPISFVLTKPAAESLINGLISMLQRLRESTPITKQ